MLVVDKGGKEEGAYGLESRDRHKHLKAIVSQGQRGVLVVDKGGKEEGAYGLESRDRHKHLKVIIVSQGQRGDETC